MVVGIVYLLPLVFSIEGNVPLIHVVVFYIIYMVCIYSICCSIKCNHYTNYTKTKKYLTKPRIDKNVRYNEVQQSAAAAAVRGVAGQSGRSRPRQGHCCCPGHPHSSGRSGRLARAAAAGAAREGRGVRRGRR